MFCSDSDDYNASSAAELTENHCSSSPSRGWGKGVSYPRPRDVWGALPSLKNMKYTRMHHF